MAVASEKRDPARSRQRSSPARARPARAEPAPDAASRLDRIVAAAQKAFIAHGYHGASTDMIQAEAGVSKATLYRYFPSKAQLFKESLAAYSKDFLTSIGRISATHDDPERFLFEFGVQFVRALCSPRGLDLFRLMVAEAARFPEVGRLFYAVGPRVTVELLETYLAAAHARGALNVPDPATSAEQFMGMVRGEIFLRCLLAATRPPTKAQTERFVRATVANFLAAHPPERSSAGE
jgi:TetR/AcrR family transcriptional repressor of mexJK operon